MHWILWGLTFAIINIPILMLLTDRILAVPADKLIRYVWYLAGVLLAIILWIARASDPALLELFLWGLLGGFLATVGLDIVRLFGHHVLKAFPADMPRIFGLLALGLAPRLQENMIAGMVGRLAEAEPDMRRRMLAERLVAIAKLPDPIRLSVARAMRKGLANLPEEQRLRLMETQMALLAELPSEVRRPVMQAMDLAMADRESPAYAQPRGMPKVPMQVARELLDGAIPKREFDSKPPISAGPDG